jgi:hypothetical protein
MESELNLGLAPDLVVHPTLVVLALIEMGQAPEVQMEVSALGFQVVPMGKAGNANAVLVQCYFDVWLVLHPNTLH